MDLVAGARRVVIAMEHTTKDGSAKILEKCTLPLTGVKVVNTIVTELAYINVTPEGLVLEEIAPGLTPEDVQKATEARLIVSPKLKTMECGSSKLLEGGRYAGRPCGTLLGRRKIKMDGENSGRRRGHPPAL